MVLSIPKKTTTSTATNNEVNANSGRRPVIQIVGQGRKYNQKLSRKGWCMQNSAPGLVII